MLVILGIALQQTVRDLAAGVIFFLFKPFASGELIGTNAFIGTVEEIQLFNTVLVQGDNKVVILPNSQVQQNGITNYSRMGTLRIDLVFGIDYGDDLRKARQVLEEIMAADPRVLRDPAPQVIVLALGDSSVNLGVRPWVKVQDYWSRPVRSDRTGEAALRRRRDQDPLPPARGARLSGERVYRHDAGVVLA